MPPPEPAPVVLVAEDDYLERTLMCDVFAELGFRVRDARDGAEALAIAAHEPVDLVLADLDMPHLDGLTLCRKLGDRPATRHVPVVLVSGVLSAWEPPPDCAAAFLAKPFSVDELEVAVERVMGGA